MCLPTKTGSTNILKAISKLESGKNELGTGDEWFRNGLSIFSVYCQKGMDFIRSKLFSSVWNPALNFSRFQTEPKLI